MDLSWEKAVEAAGDRVLWRQRVAQCIVDAGWTKEGPSSQAYSL